MNRKITIQQQTTGTDPEGIPLPATWADVFKGFAAREPLRGREFFEAAASNAEKTVRYKMRYRTGIEEDMRLIDTRDNKTYVIKAVLDDVYGDRTETHLMTEEVSDG